MNFVVLEGSGKMDSIITLLNTIENYINQKLVVFQQLYTLTLEQAKVLEHEEVDLLSFENLLDKKDKPIQKLDQINEDLSLILDQNEQLLSSGLEVHKEQINQIRSKLEKLTSIGEDISRAEETNKEKIDRHFNVKKQDISAFKKSKQVASKYNQNMSDTHQSDMSYFMDRKK